MRTPAALAARLRRSPTALAATVYLGALFVARWLPHAAASLGAAACLGLLALAVDRAGRRLTPSVTVAFGFPLHLALLATGGVSSPLLPLLVLWLSGLALLVAPPRLATTAALAALLLLAGDAWTGTLSGREALEGAAVGMMGVAVAGWRRRRTRPERADGGRAPAPPAAVLYPRLAIEDAFEPTITPEHLARELERIRVERGACRVILWEVDLREERARPRRVSGGEAPAPVALAGDPLRLACDEGLTLRLERPPRWATAATRGCVIVPFEHDDGRALALALELGEGQAFPAARTLEETRSYLAAQLRMERQEARMAASKERFLLLLDTLRRLPNETDPATLGAALCDAALRLVGGTGALAASWNQEHGKVLARAGDDGGPALGATFGPLESELALAARNGTTLVRERSWRDAGALPVAAKGERWYAEPRTLVVVPLQAPPRGAAGVLAVWSADPMRLDPEALSLLEMLAPYAALQLQQARAFDDLREDTETDALTGLRNRRGLEARLREADASFRRHAHPTALIILDVDHFKKVNDTYGHEAGDAVLRAIGDLVRGSVRETDFAARMGGEEFVVLLPETTLAGAHEFAERLRGRIEQAIIEWRGRTIPVRASIGVSACPECTPDLATLLETADAALYASKTTGRNRVTAAPRRKH